MAEFLPSTSLFAVVLTLAAYELGCFCQQRTGSPVLNPILMGSVGVGAVLLVLHVPIEAYQQGCQIFSWLLTPATVCLAIPLHTQFSRLRHSLPAILAGVTAGTLTSLLGIGFLCRVFGLNAVLTASLIPKSITTAMGIVVSESSGGDAAITTAAIIATGILGSVTGPILCKLFRLTHPSAQGVAFGTAAHVVGTSKAADFGETAEATSSLALVTAGILTAVLCSLS